MTHIKHSHFKLGALISTLCLAGLAAPALAFESGSTGADGDFSPTVNTELQIPASGVFNFTTVNIPTGVTVTFKKNTSNTPVVILASGNVTIAGSINIRGGNAAHVGAAGDGNLGDDGIPGVGGPGGYDGGRGGEAGKKNGGAGLGPGAGGVGNVFNYWTNSGDAGGGGGGGFGAAGAAGWTTSSAAYTGLGGTAYGSSQLLPLIGGSGGGGGAGGLAFAGSGGGGGGGAVLIASSGTVSVAGSIVANGGAGGTSAGDARGATGGGGSGGAIRIVATAISGNGTISAQAGAAGTGAGYTGTPQYYQGNGGAGAVGRVRLEAETFTRTAASTPAHSFGSPSSVFVAGLPTLRITSVAGVAAPTNPTGNADITLPSSTPNPVTVEFATTGVPVGNTVSLRVTPAYGTATTVVSPAVTGTTTAGTASVSATLPSGPSVLSATTTYTIVTAMGEALSIYAQGETVEKVRLTTTMNGPTLATLITKSGKEFEVPHAALAMIGS
ncbi:MAG: hypothetical protein K0B16_05420 [Burkholderiaceae bacterium]|nr:hypothetical protein [Burkholderiaceae bacterium]